MELNAYGVTLKRLTKDKIELVRHWRNDPKIAKHMNFREYITPEMQVKWFDCIDNRFNYYFLIVYKGLDVGLVNVKDINYDFMEGESGIFIFEDSFLNTDLSIRASLCKNDYFFLDFNLIKMTGHVLSDNKRAIRFNRAFGSHPLPNQEGIKYQKWVTYKDNYLIARNNLIKLLR